MCKLVHQKHDLSDMAMASQYNAIPMASNIAAMFAVVGTVLVRLCGKTQPRHSLTHICFKQTWTWLHTDNSVLDQHQTQHCFLSL